MGVFAGPSTNAGWALIYRWSPNGNDVPITYQVNNSATARTFSKILYIVNYINTSGTTYRVWAEVEDFTGSQVNRVGPPESWVYEQNVNITRYYYNTNAVNFPGALSNTITSSASPVTGRINFWPSNYGTTGGNNSLYDYDDDGYNTSNGYGSFQLFDMTNSGKCIFAWNAWNQSGGDFGLGNSSGTHPDWTFAFNGNNFPNSYCEVYVR
jgi:hypothetical protein